MTQHYVPSQPLPSAPQGPAPRAPQPPPAGPARMRNALGVWSLVLGILGLVFSWVPFAGMGTYATAVIGLILGLVGVGRVAKHVADNKGVAVSGVILNAVALVSVLLATVAYSAMIYAAGTSPGRDADQLPSTTITGRADPGTGGDAGRAGSGTGSGTANEPRAKGIGDRVRDGDLRFKVTSVRQGVSHLGGDFGKDAQGQYVVFNVNVKNVGDESVTFDDGDQYLFGAGGKRFSTDTEAGIDVNSNSFLEDINPGNTVHGKLVFDVPKSFKADHLELHGSMFSEGTTVRVTR